MTRTNAIKNTLAQALAGSPDVHLLGEALELSPATQGLMASHPDQVHLLPAADATLVGVALGMAFAGSRPVVELSGPNALWGALQHIGQEAAPSGDGEFSCGVVLRVPVATGELDLAQVLAHIDGLILASPSTQTDAAAMLESAIDSTRPVIILEPRGLPPGTPQEAVPFGKAVLRHTGDHATVLAWGAGVAAAEQAALTLQDEGIGVDVIDLRTLCPLDAATIKQSVYRTGRAIVVGELATVLNQTIESAFLRLESPPATCDSSTDSIVQAVRTSVHY